MMFPDFHKPSTTSVLQKRSPWQLLRTVLFRNHADNWFSGIISSLVILLFACSGVKAHAATYTGTFSFYSSRTLTAVKLSELGLSAAGKANSEGTYTTDVTWDGDTTEQIMSADQVYSSTVVQRNNVAVWYYTYKNSEPLPNFNVSYTITSQAGNANELSRNNDSSSTINATITAVPLGTPSNSGSNKICYGYANLTIDIANAKKSGTYKGTIRVDITYI